VAAAGGFSCAYCALGFIIPVVILEIRDFNLSRSSSSSRATRKFMAPVRRVTEHYSDGAVCILSSGFLSCNVSRKKMLKQHLWNH